MKKMVLLLAQFAISAVIFAQTAVLTDCEWFTGNDPGVGNGNDISIGTNENQESLTFSVVTGSFTAGELVRVKIRCRVDSLRSGALNVWGPVTEAFISLAPTGVARLVTSMSYQVDNGSYIDVDVPDAGIANFSELISTVGLSDGLHRVRIRSTDDLGRTGLVTDGYFVISSNSSSANRLVTQMEYRFDGDTFTNLNLADAGIVNFNELISSNALAIGLHNLDLRSIDDLGRIGPVSRSFIIVTSPFDVGQSRSLVAAEYFVNADPGAGNGVAIPLPDDATWDEREEQLSTLLTGLPVGLHLVGIRTRDDAGRWSQAIADSIIVGPVLVIRSSGNNIVLNWESGPGTNQFKIYRAASSEAAYTLLDSTATQTYTDVNAISAANQSFYYVTFETNGFSSFRLPNRIPPRE